ncbi:hypothetical protein [Nocardioides sp. GY 10127]|uniref:hypothetical protein n=1 Tax=Nocardioides sp. GY 10127 TaxID=2569762 RepID=UPI0010A90E81|nr:hypothetical protein [Nocardioides sp. GY 10127]TIC78777.1 hypothetical protein E8D37_18955 [Nocardioides sp. GY 10127]
MTNTSGTTPSVPSIPAADSSPLAGLRARREAARAELTFDLPVPLYDPPLYMRFRAVTHEQITGHSKRLGKTKALDKDVSINAAVLADAAVGVFDDSDPEEIIPLLDLVETLQMPEKSTAGDVIRELLLRDGDIIAMGAKVSERSGYSLEDLEERERGN